MKNLIVAQSGGPTSAINATLAGVYQGAVKSGKINHVFGSLNGIEGILNNNIINLNDKLCTSDNLKLLCTTPSSALGSCRRKLKSDEEFKIIIDSFKKNDIGYFIYIGGNDSMDTVYKLSQYCIKNGIEDIKIIGAPKTIDNDLCETDHCPGFGSAAKYIASTFSELRRDIDVYKTNSVTIVEVMGRNAGWLTASSALADINGQGGPNLIYLCEKPLDENTFIDDVSQKIKQHGNVLVAVSEGAKDKTGGYLGQSMQSGKIDAFGHSYLAGIGKYLETLVQHKIGCKVRSIELNLMQRCSAHIASETDIKESYETGCFAAESALNGESGKMVIIKRISNTPYKTSFSTEDIQKIANLEKTVPLEWINKEGNYITKEIFDYISPLIQGETNIQYENGIPKHIKLY